MKRNNYKVHASMIRLDAERAKIKEVGPKLVIPLTYSGWFQLLINNDVELHSLKTIRDVSNRQITEFMIHNPITAFRCAKRSAGDDKLDPVHLAAGQVLTTKSVLTEWLSEESVDGGCFCFGGARRKHNPDNNKINRSGNSNSYMKVCHDDGSQLLLPYSTEGVLFEIGRRTDVSDEDAIYRLADVVRWRQLPVDLKLVRGQLPDVLADCTGLFRLHQLAVGGTISPSGGDGSDRQLVEFADDCESDILPRCKTWSTLPRLGDTNPVSPSKIGSQEEWTADIRGVEEAISWHHPKEDNLWPGTALQTRSTLPRSLPPTPLLPQSVRQKTKGWLWAKTWLNKHRKSSTDLQELDISEDSDYEVIPFYLRSGNALTESESLGKDPDGAPDRTISVPLDVGSSDVDDDVRSVEVNSAPSPSPPPTPTIGTRAGRQSDNCLDEARNEVGLRRDPANRHDEDGYLLPVDVSSWKRDTESGQISSSEQNGAVSFDEYPTSATLTRTRDIITVPTRTTATWSSSSSSAGAASSSSSTTGSVNRSSVTLLAPNSSSTMPSCAKGTEQSEYGPAKFDQQRLDAFLADSIDELRRRQSRHPATNVGGSRPRRGRVPQVRADEADPLGGGMDVETFLDRIFDCDSMLDDKADLGSHSSANNAPATAFPSRRSMSVPESMLVRPDQRLRSGSRRRLECGYQTIDSGIWLSPRSAVSDPYRQERDSATYRSTSDCSWVPPENVDQLTVEEVGLSLRYIGMKELVVTRFYEEQIDGKQLAELTDNLIDEGFPELNALERKKLRDFIKGWRPKKWGYPTAE